MPAKSKETVTKSSAGVEHDVFDDILAGWNRERPDLDTTPMGVLGRIIRIAQRADTDARKVMSQFGLDPGTFNILASLRRAAPEHRLYPTELLNSLWITSGAVTKQVDRLEKMGLVVRKKPHQDRRSVLICLTPKGQKLIDSAVKAHVADQAAMLANFPSDDLDHLSAMLRTMLASIVRKQASDRSKA